MKNNNVYPLLGLCGLETPLSESETMMREAARHFSKEVLRPAGIRLDKLPAEQVIESDSEYWKVFAEFSKLGLSLGTILKMPSHERGRLMPLLFEEFGWGDGGLGIAIAASILPWLMMYTLNNQALLARYPEGSLIGCWGMTEPDHGSDTVDFGRMCAAPNSQYGRPNCVVRTDGNDLLISGQKSSWVLNGPTAQLCVLFSAYDDGSDEMENCVVLVPLDAKGVSRGKPIDKLGQRPAPQGALFFDEVRVSRDHLLVAPGSNYTQAFYTIWNETNMIMASIWTGCARAAYEHALSYAHERIQGGVPIIQHQNVRYRLFHMFLKIEAARALNHRAFLFNATAPIPALQGSIASKITSTQTAFEVTSEAIQICGGNGLTNAFPVEKLLRDARAAMLEDGCNELLAIKGGSLLIDPEKFKKI
jgi:acyl-CoA dehydrogenase